MIFIYTDKFTNRLKYIADHIFNRILGQTVNIINKEEDLPTNPSAGLIVYSETLKVKGALHIIPNGLLFKKGVREYDIDMGLWDEEKVFFCTQGGDIPFDIFAASFYLLSRYEEYLPNESNFNEDGTFKSKCSLAYKEGFLERPIIDIWAYKLEGMLKEKFTDYTPSSENRFRFLPIVAVNSPYKYRTYSILGNILRMGRKLIHGEFSAFMHQLKILLTIENDPYCNIDKIVEIHNRNSLRPLFALRVSNNKWYKRPIYFAYSSYKNILYRNYQISLLASEGSSFSSSQLRKEKKCLSKIFKMRIVSNIFLKSDFIISDVYSNLSRCNIKEDFSMQYPDRVGFRTSTCTPFRIYNLKTEEYYSILLHSVAFSDWSFARKSLSKKQIADTILDIANEVKKVNGELVIMSHNDSYTESGRLKGWTSVYEYSARYLSALEGGNVAEAGKLLL